jgi:hypothetical protein
MQHLEGSDTPVLYTGRTVLKGLYFQLLFRIIKLIPYFVARHRIFRPSNSVCYWKVFYVKNNNLCPLFLLISFLYLKNLTFQIVFTLLIVTILKFIYKIRSHP